MFLQESPFLQEQPLEVFCKKKMFLKISQILQDLQASNFIKKRLQTQVFSVNCEQLPLFLFHFQSVHLSNNTCLQYNNTLDEIWVIKYMLIHKN